MIKSMLKNTIKSIRFIKNSKRANINKPISIIDNEETFFPEYLLTLENEEFIDFYKENRIVFSFRSLVCSMVNIYINN